MYLQIHLASDGDVIIGCVANMTVADVGTERTDPFLPWNRSLLSLYDSCFDPGDKDPEKAYAGHESHDWNANMEKVIFMLLP